jgi:AcrR family transcriptional regulator
MRVKTDAKRQAILEAAAEVFREQGFEGATMSAICERVGGSKATLYSYFDSKDELFIAVTLEAVEDEADALFDSLSPAGDLRTTLERCGAGYLKLRLSSAALAIQRVILAQGGRSDLGKMLYERGPRECWGRMADFLEQAMDAGLLRRAAPWTVACQLKGLLEADLADRAMLGVEVSFSAERLRRAAREGVDVFLRAYGLPTEATAAGPAAKAAEPA